MLFCPNKPILVQLNVSLPTTYKALHIYLSAYAYETWSTYSLEAASSTFSKGAVDDDDDDDDGST